MSISTRTDGTFPTRTDGQHFPGFPGYVQGMFRLGNVRGRMGEACAAEYTRGDAWKCAMGQYRMPFVETPYLMVASEADSFQRANIMNCAFKTRNCVSKSHKHENYVSPTTNFV